MRKQRRIRHTAGFNAPVRSGRGLATRIWDPLGSNLCIGLWPWESHEKQERERDATEAHIFSQGPVFLKARNMRDSSFTWISMNLKQPREKRISVFHFLYSIVSVSQVYRFMWATAYWGCDMENECMQMRGGPSATDHKAGTLYQSFAMWSDSSPSMVDSSVSGEFLSPNEYDLIESIATACHG